MGTCVPVMFIPVYISNPHTRINTHTHATHTRHTCTLAMRTHTHIHTHMPHKHTHTNTHAFLQSFKKKKRKVRGQKQAHSCDGLQASVAVAQLCISKLICCHKGPTKKTALMVSWSYRSLRYLIGRTSLLDIFGINLDSSLAGWFSYTWLQALKRQ